MADKRTIQKLDKRIEELVIERDEARKWWEHWQHRGMEAEAERDRLVAIIDNQDRRIEELETTTYEFDFREIPEDAVITDATLIYSVPGSPPIFDNLAQMLERRVEELEKVLLTLFLDELTSHAARAMIRETLGIEFVPFVSPMEMLARHEKKQASKLIDQLGPE